MSETTFPKTWAIVEVMGHQVYAGEVSEETIAGNSFVRIDIPETKGQPAFTKMFGAGSIYCITPTKEDIARVMAERHCRRPVSEYDLPDEWRQKLSQPLIAQRSEEPIGLDPEFDDGGDEFEEDYLP